MFSLIPKTDTGLWLGPLLVQSTSSSFNYPRPFGQSWQLFLIGPVLAGSIAVMWTVIMHLRELRLLFYSRYLLSPALLSPHHIAPRIKSTQLVWQWFSFPCHPSCRESADLLANWRMCKKPKKSPYQLKLFCPSADFVYKRGAFIVVLPTACITHPSSQSVSWWTFIRALQRLEVTFFFFFLILSFRLLLVCLRCKWASFSLTSLHIRR